MGRELPTRHKMYFEATVHTAEVEVYENKLGNRVGVPELDHTCSSPLSKVTLAST